MRKLRYVLAGVLMLGLAFPAVTLADDDDDSDRGGRRCSNIGTWFQVESPDDTRLAGAIWTAIGKSENHGTNILEQPNFSPTLLGAFPDAVESSTLRGNWDRTGNRTFVYSLMGYAVDAAYEIEYITKVKGDIEMTRDCRFVQITVLIEVYVPQLSPWDYGPVEIIDFGAVWGRRAHVELP